MDKPILIPNLPSVTPPEGDHKIDKQFNWSATYPALIENDGYEVYAIIYFNLRENVWVNLDGMKVNVICWYSPKEVQDV